MSDDKIPNPEEQAQLLREADAEYRPFLGFAECAPTAIDNERWERSLADLQEYAKAPKEQLSQAREVVRRVAAIETGVIEGLYPEDRGFTFSAAQGIAIWEAALKNARPRSGG